MTFQFSKRRTVLENAEAKLSWRENCIVSPGPGDNPEMMAKAAVCIYKSKRKDMWKSFER